MTYLHVGSRVPVLNKCWKAGTGVLIAKRSQRKSIFPKEQSDQEMIISDGKEWAENTRKQPDLVGLSENHPKNVISQKGLVNFF